MLFKILSLNNIKIQLLKRVSRFAVMCFLMEELQRNTQHLLTLLYAAPCRRTGELHLHAAE